jgi:SAM-dependent methyltransferase
VTVVWHDLECGGYVADLPLWRELARERGGPILDVGAGTGRVALELARNCHEITALDRDTELLEELRRRAGGLPVSTVVADARSFELEVRFPLCIMPMQTVQLLDRDGRASFLGCARRHLAAGGLLAAALSESLEPYDVADGGPLPLPDMCERDGVVYSSAPTAIRVDDAGFVLERRREAVNPEGDNAVELNSIRLDRVSAAELEREGAAAGLEPLARRHVPATADYVGSVVVMLGA